MLYIRVLFLISLRNALMPTSCRFPDDVLLRVGGETSAYASVVKDPDALNGFALDGPLSHIVEVLARTMNFS